LELCQCEGIDACVECFGRCDQLNRAAADDRDLVRISTALNVQRGLIKRPSHRRKAKPFFKTPGLRFEQRLFSRELLPRREPAVSDALAKALRCK